MSTTINAIDSLQALYAAGFQDTFLDNALRKIVEFQISQDEARLEEIHRELATFEHRFGMTSDEFWKRYQAGNMADDADLMEWNVFCKMRQRILNRLNILSYPAAHG